MVEGKVVRRGKEDEPWLRETVGAPEYVEPGAGDLADDGTMVDDGMPAVTTTNGVPATEAH